MYNCLRRAARGTSQVWSRCLSSTPARTPPPSKSLRISAYLARCGLGSRQACAEFVKDGRVTVHADNEEPRTLSADDLNFRAIPSIHSVMVDGRPVTLPSSKQYFLVNKPPGEVVTQTNYKYLNKKRHFAQKYPDRPFRAVPKFDDSAMNRFVAERDRETLFPVGRLDKNSSGALLVTNDGEFAQLVNHPRYPAGTSKLYFVRTEPAIPPAMMFDAVTSTQHSFTSAVPVFVPSLSSAPTDTMRDRVVENVVRTIGPTPQVHLPVPESLKCRHVLDIMRTHLQGERGWLTKQRRAVQAYNSFATLRHRGEIKHTGSDEEVDVARVRMNALPAWSDWCVVLDEGKNRQIRRVLNDLWNKYGPSSGTSTPNAAKTGDYNPEGKHTDIVKRLVRLSVGSIGFGSLPQGQYRALSENEMRWVQWLKHSHMPRE